MLEIALRNVRRQRARTGLTLAAIAIGVTSLLLAGGFVEDLLHQLRESTIRSGLGHMQIYRQGQYASGGHRPSDYLIDNPEQVERAVDRLPDVVAHAKRLNFSGLISNGRGERPMIAEGVEPILEARIGSAISMIAGSGLSDRDGFGVIVGEGLAKAMQLKVGDPVNLVVSTREGAMNTLDFSVAGIFRSFSKEYDARAVRVPLKAAQELMVTPAVNAVVVLLGHTDSGDAARTDLAARLPAGYEIKTWPELADFYRGTEALYRRQFAVLQIIILVMVLLGVANSVNMSLHERTAEFGIMRALGRTSRYVFRLAVLETVLLGIIGGALGVALGVILALGISAIGIPMPPPPNSDVGFTGAIRIVPTLLVAAFALGVVASAGAALLPARHLARLPLVEALRRGV